MNRNRRVLFSNFTFENWKNLILFAIIFFYFINLIASFGYGSVGNDYFAFWSVGKIADEKGYSEIYDLNNLRSVQTNEHQALGNITNTDDPPTPTIPVPYFSFFVVPFQLISRIDLIHGYLIWTFLNLIILIGYLVFFLRRTNPESDTKISGLKLLILMLISWPVFFNTVCGQMEVILLVCAGEFVRYAVSKKPVLSGIWLGGLLLKPQLLILIVPIFLIMRNWKVLMGFIGSSGIILITSLLLSGIAGMKALINLWIRYSVGMASNFPEGMINWRMVGVNVNALLNTSLGWVITGLGMVLTIVAVYFLIKHNPPFGSSQWIMVILGVFSATLAITWHSHYHMAMVLIPFLIHASIYKLLPEKIIFFWAVVTPAAWFGMLIIDLFVLVVTKMNTPNYEQMIIALSGLIGNLVILISVMRFTNNLNLKQY
jgi:hypothetical protein